MKFINASIVIEAASPLPHFTRFVWQKYTAGTFTINIPIFSVPLFVSFHITVREATVCEQPHSESQQSLQLTGNKELGFLSNLFEYPESSSSFILVPGWLQSCLAAQVHLRHLNLELPRSTPNYLLEADIGWVL